MFRGKHLEALPFVLGFFHSSRGEAIKRAGTSGESQVAVSGSNDDEITLKSFRLAERVLPHLVQKLPRIVSTTAS